jgi:hypothetical protein
VITEGPWVKMKKPAWEAMPVLDIQSLNRRQETALAAAYDELAGADLLSIARLHEDETRAAVDTALAQALRLPDLAPLRSMLVREPGLVGLRGHAAVRVRRGAAERRREAAETV